MYNYVRKITSKYFPILVLGLVFFLLTFISNANYYSHHNFYKILTAIKDTVPLIDVSGMVISRDSSYKPTDSIDNAL